MEYVTDFLTNIGEAFSLHLLSIFSSTNNLIYGFEIFTLSITGYTGWIVFRMSIVRILLTRYTMKSMDRSLSLCLGTAALLALLATVIVLLNGVKLGTESVIPALRGKNIGR
jgi:hypothetical protein